MYGRFRGAFSRPTNRPTISQTLPAFCPPVAHPRAGHQDAEIRAMLDQDTERLAALLAANSIAVETAPPDLPDLPAVKARRQTDTPLVALHQAWRAAMSCHNSCFDDCDSRPGSDQSLSAATFALVLRLEAEIAAYVPETLQDLALKFIACEFEVRCHAHAEFVREVHAFAGVEMSPFIADQIQGLGPRPT